MRKKNTKLSCRECGATLLVSESPAENHSYTEFYLSLCSVGFRPYNSKGERQILNEYVCPKYGETRGFFKKRVKHDKFVRKIDGFKYETFIISSY